MLPQLWTATIIDQLVNNKWQIFSSQLCIVGQVEPISDQEYLEECQKRDPVAILRIRPEDDGVSKKRKEEMDQRREEAKRRREVIDARHARIKAMRERGLGVREIAEAVGMTRQSVYNVCLAKGLRKGKGTHDQRNSDSGPQTGNRTNYLSG